jgi:hypothetical protein
MTPRVAAPNLNARPALPSFRRFKPTAAQSHSRGMRQPLFLTEGAPTPPQAPGRLTVKNAAKICSHCGQRKPAKEFRRNRRNRDGLSSWCAECHNEATRRWREANRERMNEARRVVPRYVYLENVGRVENPSKRPKSKVR